MREENDRTYSQFLADVALHKMQVVRDDGVFRFVRFRRPNSLSYHFDLVTWPGCLCIAGDMGTYVFARGGDMFTFFRDDGLPPLINPGYWGEKLLSVSKSEGFEEYSEKAFVEAVTDYFEQWFEDFPNREKRDQCWEAITNCVLRFADDEHAAYSAVYSFEHDGFMFDDFFEHRLVDYTYQYLWACHAIVWGIAKYDKPRVASAKCA